MITISQINNDVDFCALQEEWNELLQSSLTNSLFLTWEWLYLWWQHLREDRKLHLVTVRQEGLLIAIAPLAVRPSRLYRLIPFRVLEFLGNGYVGSDYLNFIIRKGFESKAIQAIAENLSEQKLALELSQVERSTYPAINLARQLQFKDWRSDRLTTGYCPYIRLAGHTWDSYLASLGSSHRQNFRRKLRKLHNNFEVHFEQARTEEQCRLGLNILFSLHNKRRQERGGSNAFNTAGLREFHRQYTRLAFRKNQLKLFVIWLNGVPAAALYGFSYNKTFYYYQTGFDPAFSRHSVGLVILGLVIKHAIEEGHDEYDLLHGDESYKYLWAQQERELVRINQYPPHLVGMSCQFMMRLRSRVMNFLQPIRTLRIHQ